MLRRPLSKIMAQPTYQRPQNAFTMDDLAIPVTYPSFIMRTLCKRAYRPDLLLKDTRLDAEAFQSPNTRFSFYQLRRFILNVLELTGDDHIAISLAQQFEAAQIGFPAYAAMTAPTLKDGLEVMTSYCFLTFPAIDFSLSDADSELSIGEAAIYMRPKFPLDEIEYFVCASALLVCDGLLRAMLRADNVTLRADTIAAKPKSWAQVADRIGFPVSFSTLDNRLIFPQHLLERPLPGADPINHPQLVSVCKNFSATIAFNTTPVMQVKQCLEQEQGLRKSFSRIAKELGYSERSLRRQLEQSDTSYRKLVDQVREARARHLVAHSTKPIQAIAHDLGFDKPSNFTRSFKRWTGNTPSLYRQGRTGGGRN